MPFFFSENCMKTPSRSTARIPCGCSRGHARRSGNSDTSLPWPLTESLATSQTTGHWPAPNLFRVPRTGLAPDKHEGAGDEGPSHLSPGHAQAHLPIVRLGLGPVVGCLHMTSESPPSIRCACHVVFDLPVMLKNHKHPLMHHSAQREADHQSEAPLPHPSPLCL